MKKTLFGILFLFVGIGLFAHESNNYYDYNYGSVEILDNKPAAIGMGYRGREYARGFDLNLHFFPFHFKKYYPHILTVQGNIMLHHYFHKHFESNYFGYGLNIISYFYKDCATAVISPCFTLGFNRKHTNCVDFIEAKLNWPRLARFLTNRSGYVFTHKYKKELLKNPLLSVRYGVGF